MADRGPLRPRVITGADARAAQQFANDSPGGGSPPKEDPYLAKVIKYIPAEIVAAYQTLSGFLKAGDRAHPDALFWTDVVIVVILAALTPPWIRFAASDATQGLPAPKYQAWASLTAFLIWVFALDGLWATGLPQWFQDLRPMWGSMLLVIATLAIPILERRLSKSA